MIRSMTGYGRREAPVGQGTVAVEVRAVNHRFCEVIVRVPRFLGSLEEELKREVQRRCARGRVEVTVSLTGEVEGRRSLSLDRSLARQYYRLLCELQRELRLAGSVDLALVAGLRELVSVVDQPADSRPLARLVGRLAKGALADLDAMRRREGTALARDLRRRLQTVRAEVRLISARSPQVVREAFERMKARVEKLLAPRAVDEGRLHQELAVFADRCDVSEELTRLESHLAQFDGALGSREAVGRTLDFLLQEMGREINTVGAKANDAEIAGRVVRVKGELEKIREQVQNIE
ncbi:YicC/YloC family endoribonuclease [Nitrospira sp. Kam-Ns4a]